MRLHARAPAGTRLEETEARFAAIEREIRSVIPPGEIEMLIDNIGIPNSWPAIAQGDIPTISSADGEILISLNKEKHGPTAEYEDTSSQTPQREVPRHGLLLPACEYHEPDHQFRTACAYRPADRRPQRRGELQSRPAARRPYLAHSGRGRCPRPSGRRAARNPPQCGSHARRATRTHAARRHQQHAHLAQRQRHLRSQLLAESRERRELYDRCPDSAVPNRFARRAAPYASLAQQPCGQRFHAGIAGGGRGHQPHVHGAAPGGATQAYGNPGAIAGSTQMLTNLVSVERSYTPVIVNHYNVWPVFDVYANVANWDLGGVGKEVRRIMREEESKLPRGTTLNLRGQVETMQSSFFRLGLGLIFAVVLVYLLMTVNFQSWVDPFIILMALPGAMAGILWMLFVTGTTLSVPSLMGSIMCIGVATANSILMVTFANDEREEGLNAREAMLSAGLARIRPVLMTATAMILGMLPMSLGLGEGGEQNAPLGRAVIGGLLLATVNTLFVVPIVYSYLRKKPPVDHERRLMEVAPTGNHALHRTQCALRRVAPPRE